MNKIIIKHNNIIERFFFNQLQFLYKIEALMSKCGENIETNGTFKFKTYIYFLF